MDFCIFALCIFFTIELLYFIFLLESAIGHRDDIGDAVAYDQVVDSRFLLFPDDHYRPDVHQQGDQRIVVNDMLTIFHYR